MLITKIFENSRELIKRFGARGRGACSVSFSEAEAHVGSAVILGNRERGSYLRQRQLHLGGFFLQQGAEPQSRGVCISARI
jgi:hypothetical protein